MNIISKIIPPAFITYSFLCHYFFQILTLPYSHSRTHEKHKCVWIFLQVQYSCCCHISLTATLQSVSYLLSGFTLLPFFRIFFDFLTFIFLSFLLNFFFLKFHQFLKRWITTGNSEYCKQKISVTPVLATHRDSHADTVVHFPCYVMAAVQYSTVQMYHNTHFTHFAFGTVTFFLLI